jgi:hypothetical protein
MGFTRVILGVHSVLFDSLADENCESSDARALADYKRKVLKRLGRLLLANDRAVALEVDVRHVFCKEAYDGELLSQKVWLLEGIEYASFTDVCRAYNKPWYYTSDENFSNMVRKRLGKLGDDPSEDVLLDCYRLPPRVIRPLGCS